MGIEDIRRLKQEARMPKEKKVYYIPKQSEKKKKEVAEGKKSGSTGELDRWFNERHKELTGKCDHCGGKTCKGTPQYKCSIAHLLPKRLFKSIKTHPLNALELCFWGNNCHGNMDNNMLDLTEMNCWDKIVERFVAIYPSIDKKERKYIPDALLQYAKNESDLI